MMAITGLVLAGGQGSRMGGQDKGLVEYLGRPLVDHVLDCITPQVDTVLISANRNLDAYASRGVPVIVDSMPGYQGPLAGVLSGLRAHTSEWVLTTPCDMPHLPRDLCNRLMAGLNGKQIAVAADEQGIHPVVMLLHANLKYELADYLQSGRRSVHGFQERVGFATVLFDSEEMRNVNSLAEILSA